MNDDNTNDSNWGDQLTAGLLVSNEARRNQLMRQRFFVYNDSNLVDLGEFLVAASRPVLSYSPHPEGIEIEIEVSSNQLDRVANKATSRGLVVGGIAQLPAKEEPAPTRKPRRSSKKQEEEPAVEEALAEEAQAAEE